jgi:hypothetical protein
VTVTIGVPPVGSTPARASTSWSPEARMRLSSNTGSRVSRL